MLFLVHVDLPKLNDFSVCLGGFFNFGYVILQGKVVGSTQSKGLLNMCSVTLINMYFPLYVQYQAIVCIRYGIDLQERLLYQQQLKTSQERGNMMNVPFFSGVCSSSFFNPCQMYFFNLSYNLQILYETSKENQEDLPSIGYSLKITSEMMDLLLKSLTEGNECYIQMDSVDDGGSGVFYLIRC